MSKPPSMGGIFEKRGDPMVSQREGQEKYNRLLDIEDAAYDADRQRLSSKYWERKLADELRKIPTAPPVKSDVPDSPEVILQRQARNIVRKMNAKFKPKYRRY